MPSALLPLLGGVLRSGSSLRPVVHDDLDFRRLDQQLVGDSFRANFRREPWRGYASGPPTLFALVERQGLPYTQAARSLFGGQGSFGNGAAMRIAPLGLFFHDAPDLYNQASASACVTHAHPLGIDGAAVLAWAIARAVKLFPRYTGDSRFLPASP